MSRKVCIMTSVHSAQDIRIFHKQARSLTKAGYEIVLIGRHNQDESVDGVRIKALPAPSNRFQRIFGLTWKVFVIAFREKADIYHFHDPELLPAGALLRLLRGRPVVYDVHEDYSKSLLGRRWLPRLVRKPLSWLVAGLEKFFALFVTAIVPVTDSIASKFRSTKTFQVRNYPLLELKNPGATANRDSNRLIYVGGIRRSRGIGELVRAMEYLPEQVRLTILGRYEEPDFESELKALKGYAKVDFGGWVTLPEVWRQMTQASMGFVLFHPEPNHQDALPNKLFEYMSAGIPVIASDFPFWQEIIVANECGLQVDPLDPEAIATTISYLLENPSEIEKLGANGCRAVQEKYNWEQESLKLLDLYSKLLV